MAGIIKRELYLIRHAETFTNLDDFEPSSLLEENDPLLTEKGIAQAQALGRYYKSIQFDAVYSSALRRTVMTSNEIVKYQENHTLKILPDLCEVFINPEYQGQTLSELQALCPDAVMAEGYEDTEKLVIPDYLHGEEEELYFERAAKVLDYIEKRYNSGEKIAVVSHAGFLTYILFHLFGFSGKEPEEFDIRLSNTGVSKITYFEHGTHKYGDYVIDSINDQSHLVSLNS